jgi:extradiol dioxygenase family protein
MRTTTDVFHLAVPVYDLDDAQRFYVDLLGCKLARRYPDRITVDFFGDQLVCHLSEEEPGRARPVSMYPRHFGVTFREAADFDALHECAIIRKIPFFRDLASRFEGMAEVHRTFVMIDPSDNLLEFKHYRDSRMMY